MNRSDISARQMQSTIAMFLIGSSVISSGTNSAKQDTWITILIAVVLIIPFAWVYAEILKLYPGQNFFVNILRAMGRPVGLAVCALYAVYALYLGALVLRTFSEFVHIVNMTETPIISIMVCILAAVVYMLSNRLYVLARVSRFLLPFLYFTIFTTLILSYKNMDVGNLKPILHTDPPDFLRGILFSFTLPYGELVLCLPMFGAMNRKAPIFPTMMKGVYEGFLFLFPAVIRNSLVLGYYASISLFPSYECVSIIKIGEFFTRVEVLIGFNLLLAGFFKVGISLFSSCEGVARMFGFQDYEPLVAPLALLLLTMSILAHNNTAEMLAFLKLNPYCVLPFQVFLPILILIVGKIRKKIELKKKRGGEPAKTGKDSVSPGPQDG
ncbi:hypothetical protein EQM14_15780 [Caproiciproducens sp. NJN-50]|uniref:GerAB/ArcD/ProY family transporter n=1 Tax=Caproiciproducens sp. NJN-50 TaxID=2507162 RepID=UPI000FFE0A71|nr:endospore germination permease [Caproiciproducens sp. NJN-50]QAT51111.1 hypothetical protein EQM14_15780 [Caproiciproducens sp. NJN-50]